MPEMVFYVFRCPVVWLDQTAPVLNEHSIFYSRSQCNLFYVRTFPQATLNWIFSFLFHHFDCSDRPRRYPETEQIFYGFKFCSFDGAEIICASIFHALTTKLCGANEAQRSLRPNERIVRAFSDCQNHCMESED